MINITDKLKKIIDEDRVMENEPMCKHTTLKIGGNADYYIIIKSEKELKKVLELVKTNDIPLTILGNGSNVLVRDGGIRGIVVKLDFKEYVIGKQNEFAYITVGSGMALSALAIIAQKEGLTGLECLSGIPGTVGGAIRMNAGAYGKEMKDIVVFSKCIDKNGNIHELNLQAHKFDYRTSCFKNNDLIILETTIKLNYADKNQIQRKMDEYKESRLKNQPIELPNAGSTFKRNTEFPTAKLIDECGLKGYRIGDAEVSTKHAGFLVNKGKAKASDVLQLADYIKAQVKEKFDKDIELEILVIGEG